MIFAVDSLRCPLSNLGSSFLSEFLMTPITNCHKRSSLYNTNVFSYSYGVQKIDISYTGPKPRCLPSMSWGSTRIIHFLNSSSSWGCTACILWLTALSSISKACDILSSDLQGNQKSSLLETSLLLSLILMFVFLKLIFIRVQLRFSVVLVPDGQQSELVYMCVYPLFLRLFPYRSLQSIAWSSLCYTGSYHLFILYVVACILLYHLNPSLPIYPSPSLLGNHVCFLHLSLYFCFVNKFICTIF